MYIHTYIYTYMFNTIIKWINTKVYINTYVYKKEHSQAKEKELKWKSYILNKTVKLHSKASLILNYPRTQTNTCTYICMYKNTFIFSHCCYS